MEIDQTKLAEVQTWLSTVYNGHPPPWEVTPTTVEAMYSLCVNMQRRTKANELLCEQRRQCTKEYDLKAQINTHLLHSLNLGSDSLSKRASESLDTVCALALSLKLNSASNGSFMCAMADLVTDNIESDSALHSEEIRCQDLESMTRRALKELEETKDLISRQDAPNTVEIDQKRKEVRDFKTKIQNYESEISKFKNDVNRSGYRNEVSHPQLVKLSEDLKRVKHHVEQHNTKLQSYRDLPPDISLAHLKVENARKQLEQLEHKFSSSINRMLTDDV
eukprot:653171_1